MRIIYTILLTLALPLMWVRLWLKGRKNKAYRERVGERFSINLPQAPDIDIWIHAVSLGEAIAAEPLIDALLNQQKKLLITTTTPTGSKKITSKYGQKVTHVYLPYDLPIIVKRFLTHFKPKLCLIMETEIWPNLLAGLKKADIPVLLVNARLSERSMQGYLKIHALMQKTLPLFSAILCQTEADGARFIKLGATSEQINIIGNVKFDMKTPEEPASELKSIAQQWGQDRVVLIIASTHHDEEAQLLKHIKDIQKEIPSLLTLIVPRHPERFDEVFMLMGQYAKPKELGRRSVEQSINEQTKFILIDSMGELGSWFLLADYAFVGGSLVPVGGHNVLEPAAVGIPVFTGHYVMNFKAICDEMLKEEAIIMVNDAMGFASELIKLYKNPEHKKRLCQHAHTVLTRNKGAVNRYIEHIEKHLPNAL